MALNILSKTVISLILHGEIILRNYNCICVGFWFRNQRNEPRAIYSGVHVRSNYQSYIYTRIVMAVMGWGGGGSKKGVVKVTSYLDDLLFLSWSSQAKHVFYERSDVIVSNQPAGVPADLIYSFDKHHVVDSCYYHRCRWHCVFGWLEKPTPSRWCVTALYVRRELYWISMNESVTNLLLRYILWIINQHILWLLQSSQLLWQLYLIHSQVHQASTSTIGIPQFFYIRILGFFGLQYFFRKIKFRAKVLAWINLGKSKIKSKSIYTKIWIN